MRAAGRSTLVLLLGVMVLALVLAACGGVGRDASVTQSAGESAIAGVSTNDGSRDSAGAAAPPGAAQIADWDRRIVRTAELTLTVQNVEQAIAAVRDIATAQGGQILTSSTSYNGDYQSAMLTIEVPSDRFDPTMSALRGLPLVERVDHETTSSQDVTEEYVDLEARLRNAEATEQRLLSLQGQAERLEDILALEREIARVRGEIEQMKGRLNYLERRTSFSRIDLQLLPVAAGAGQAPGFDFARVVREAWDASMRFAGRVATVAVTVVVFLWWLWPLVAAGAVYYARRARRRGPTPGATEA